MQDYNSEHCVVEVTDEVLVVTINRADTMNSVNPQSNAELAKVFRDFEASDDLRVAILTGAGDKSFCSGNDLKFTATAKPEDLKQPPEGFGGLTSYFDRKKPVIAAVNGIAFGGGFEIALAADIIVASENAKFALPEPKVGLAALAGGMHRLPRQIPLKKAVGAMLTGDPISAEAGEQWGFINEVVSQDQLLETALMWAKKIAACAPISIDVTLQTVREGLREASIQEAVKMDGPNASRIVGTADFKEGVQAFVEKRKPNWQGK